MGPGSTHRRRTRGLEMHVTAEMPATMATAAPRRAEKLVLIGQGYVGLPLAMRAAEVGYHVIGLDVDAGRVKRLSAGESFVEDVSAHRLRAALESGRYHPTSDYADAAGFDLCVITVPT